MCTKNKNYKWSLLILIIVVTTSPLINGDSDHGLISEFLKEKFAAKEDKTDK